MAVGDIPPEARIKSSIKQAWTNIWPNFWWLLLFTLIAEVASGLQAPSGMSSQTLAAILGGLGGLISIFVGIPLSVGLVNVHLVASRGEKPTWSDLGYSFGPRYWSSIGLSLLSLLIIVGGLILLIVPGIYWGVRLSFVYPRFIEDNLGVMDAIRASRADVTGRWWNVFGLALMSIVLIIAGVLALIVGVFVAMVLIGQMSIVYWRSIQAHDAPKPRAIKGKAAA